MHRVQGRVRSGVQTGPLAGFVCLLALLGVLAATTGLDTYGWATGVACGAGLAALLARAMASHRRDGLAPADKVTLARAVLACGVAALTADSFGGQARVAPLVALSTVALVLDGIDGRIARRTGTASAFGARFDMEVDAFLILVLSVYAARTTGWWVLAIGAARYVFVVAGWALPWLRGSLPPRYWAKVVAAIEGIALTVAAAGILPDAVTTVVLLIALGLLAESFGRHIWGLWRLAGGQPGPRAAMTSALAVLLLWAALLVPDHTGDMSPAAFLRIPLEGLLFVVLVLVLPRRLTRILALIGGLLVGVLATLRLLDRGFYFAFDRPFHPVYDTAYAGSALGLLGDSIGRAGAVAVLIGAGLLCVAMLALLPLSAVRLTRLVARHRRSSIRIVAVLAAISIVPALIGAQPEPAGRIASTAAARLATQVSDDLRDQREFVRALEQDPFRGTPDDDLLAGLRGKDVLLVFVESYGRTALDSPVVESALDAGDRRLKQAGFSSRSGFLTSSTFGGLSWLAHSTLQSGLWVDNQRRYDHLVTLDRLTLTDAFGRAGWRTIADVPSNDEDWPVAKAYYHYDKVYDRRNVGYAGPQFSYASMPDQYTLAALQRLELDKPNRAPVMAEVDLVSSHTPWAPLPRLVDWSRVGDGSVFDPMPAEGDSPDDVWRDPDRVKAAYAQSIAYSLDALTSFVQQLHDRDLVLVVLGDHQPASIVSGEGASRDVPVSIIAADPAVTARVADWGWRGGLRPDAGAPVWPMDTFRDRFLTAYGP
ncbi:phosphoglycerol transferase MdoB-like AlkP superfamily enzyme [Kribbella orskensis]|uniref:Phosphoglycerol transferase MdoB-like AlkP superfamily enzyme n=1 Tax=Kribbella orskensis TaxID=2512216 RepID=A0ABY2BB53_9ACTN|nr:MULTISPECIES: CDP-alcohol phosphatidyltransferase family protein [Kribbella]TCN33563.1 phosphoglycerol transferase MdoB-like AlkP superfamily enzyme [Kribbella sp. VKM Ac-2500]TCO14030.1 phosphoglycerol transferase MdoB-like AlkP superfamily enzyme [Kribbella orskensis]